MGGHSDGKQGLGIKFSCQPTLLEPTVSSDGSDKGRSIMLVLARVVIGRSVQQCAHANHAATCTCQLPQGRAAEKPDYHSMKSSDNGTFTVFGAHHSYPAYVLHCGSELLAWCRTHACREKQFSHTGLQSRSLQLQLALDQCRGRSASVWDAEEAVSGLGASCRASSTFERASVSSASTQATATRLRRWMSQPPAEPQQAAPRGLESIGHREASSTSSPLLHQPRDQPMDAPAGEARSAEDSAALRRMLGCALVAS